MLSYRHGFHAGNHADVLKHVLWLQLLRQMTQKDKPLWVLDTHAGAGAYALDSRFAAKNREYADGIGRLWARTDLPELLRDYVAQVRAGNPDGGLRIYPRRRSRCRSCDRRIGCGCGNCTAPSSRRWPSTSPPRGAACR